MVLGISIGWKTYKVSGSLSDLLNQKLYDTKIARQFLHTVAGVQSAVSWPLREMAQLWWYWPT